MGNDAKKRECMLLEIPIIANRQQQYSGAPEDCFL